MEKVYLVKIYQDMHSEEKRFETKEMCIEFLNDFISKIKNPDRINDLTVYESIDCDIPNFIKDKENER